MSRTVTRVATSPKPSASPDPEAEKPKETMRDFVEQIVVAIILAVLIRGYDAEAFVIPTGSMAPTLMGRHKEVTCPECGLVYAINASEDSEPSLIRDREGAEKRLDEARNLPRLLAEAEADKVRADRTGDRNQIELASDRLEQIRRDSSDAPRLVAERERNLERLHEVGLCVNCRASVVVDDEPSYKGDRILVEKFPYELPELPGSAGPKRWDVVVFHFPEKPETNYIKRLVGLPDEELRVNHGDIQTRPANSTQPFQIQRKPMIHQRAMQMLVYDDAFRPRKLENKPEWRRWNPAGACKEPQPGTFAFAPGDEAGWSELRYRHLLPDPEQWAAILQGARPAREPRPTLITDFYSYNTTGTKGQSEGWLQSNWVGDLTVSCRVDLQAAQPGGMLRIELVESGIVNRCEFDLISGLVSLSHGDKKLGEAGTLLRGVGAHDVEFANVDDRLSLLIDGETIFLDGLPYDDDPTTTYAPTARDLDPVGIALKATSATVSGLVLKRDIYYTQDPKYPDYRIPGVLDGFDREEHSRVLAMFEFLANPAEFAKLKELAPTQSYAIQHDHYMMMGDNSPRSSDSRAWSFEEKGRSSWEVPRSLLIGKAFFVYWPHGKLFGPNFRVWGDLRFPFRPYVERMKWIR